MPLIAVDRFQRGGSGTGPFAVIWEDDAKVSYVTVADTAARDLIPEWKRLPYMRVHCIATATDYRLGANVTIAGQVWTEVNSGISPGTYQILSEKNQANGYVGLNSSTKIDPIYIDNIYTNSSYVVADNTARNNTTTLTGDIVVVTGSSKIFVKLNNNATPNVDADYAELLFPGVVTSVNGQVGTVSITITNLLAVGANQTAFDNAVAAAPGFTSLASQVSTNTADILDLQNDIADIQTDSTVAVKVWNISDPYVTGEYVSDLDVDGNLILYKCLTGNTGNNPESSPTFWQPVGDYTHYWRTNGDITLTAPIVVTFDSSLIFSSPFGDFAIEATAGNVSIDGANINFTGANSINLEGGDATINLGGDDVIVTVGAGGIFAYAANESSNYTDRSVTDKEYVDDRDVITLTTANTYANTHLITKDLPAVPGAGQSGQALRWNNSLDEWEYYNPAASGIGAFWALSGTSAFTGDVQIDVGANIFIFSQVFGSVNSSLNFISGDVTLASSGSGGAVTLELLRSIGVAKITSSFTGFEGLKYGGNYSADFVNRSLVDKEYVDNAVAGGGSGWTLNGSSTFTGTVTINTGANVGTINVQTGGTFVISEENGLVGFGVDPIGGIGISAYKTGGAEGISLLGTSDGTTNILNIIDDRSVTLGLQYGADYSSGFTDRSIVDKGYVVDNFWSTTGTTTLVASPVISTQVGLTSLEAIDDGDAYFGSLRIGTGGIPGMLLKYIEIASASVIKVVDDADGSGIVYDADYSGTFVARSLVDKAYVDAAAGWLLSGTTTLAGDVLVTGGTTSREIVIRSTDSGTYPSTALTLAKSGGVSALRNSASLTIYNELQIGQLQSALLATNGTDTSTITISPLTTDITTLDFNLNAGDPSVTLAIHAGSSASLTLAAPGYEIALIDSVLISTLPVFRMYSNKVQFGIVDFSFQDDAARVIVIESETNGDTTTSLKVIDNRSIKLGLEYGSDYSAGFGNRSLVDKEYVDDAIATSSAALVTISTVTTTGSVAASLKMHFVKGNTTSGAFTTTLPNANTCSGYFFIMKKTSSDTNNWTIGTAGGNIDGASTAVIAAQNTTIMLLSDGTNYSII